jgi:hypothetical protein
MLVMRLEMINHKDQIIVVLFLGCIFASITAFSLGTAMGFYVSKNITVKVIPHD